MWTVHRRRAETLRVRYPFAGEVLGLYLALLDVWDDACETAAPDPGGLAGWAAERVLPQVVKATEAAGPQPLAAACRDLLNVAPGLLAGWLAGDELGPVERYLARASLPAPLVARGTGDPSPRGDRNCPRCGGPPQLSVRADGGDPLVAGRRQLACARCGQHWAYSASACPGCGGAKLTVYAEERDGPIVGRDNEADGDGQPATFPHLRIEACDGCRRYLVDVDLGRDPAAVPEVDELAALPLDLVAAEHGLSKITPNLMGV